MKKLAPVDNIGKQLATKKGFGTSPEILQLVLLDEIAGRLADLQRSQYEIRQQNKEKTPVGKVVSLNRETVSGERILYFIINPLFSVAIFNHGPNTLRVQINNSDICELEQEDKVEINFGHPKVKKVVLQSDANTIVSMRGYY